MLFSIKDITVLINLPGTDKIILETELPSTLPLCHSQSPGFVSEAQKDTGIEYVFDHFEIDIIKVIDCNTGDKYLQLRDGTQTKLHKRDDKND